MCYPTNSCRAYPAPTAGFATLTLSMLLLSILALTSLYAAQFKLQEQRILANHQRLQQAGMIARAALTKTIFRLMTTRDPQQLSDTGTVADGRYAIEWQQTGNVVNLAATGFAPGSDSDTAVRQRANARVQLTPLLKRQPEQPLLVRGGITTLGSAVLEQWPENSLPFETVVLTDLLSDFFTDQLREQTDLQASSCDDLSAATTGFIWVRGDCRLAPLQQLGQPDRPVILIVEEGQLEFGQQAKIYGLVISLTQQAGVLVSNFGAIDGALWANHGLQLTGNKLTVTLTSSMQHWLTHHLALTRAIVIPRSWHYGPL